MKIIIKTILLIAAVALMSGALPPAAVSYADEAPGADAGTEADAGDTSEAQKKSSRLTILFDADGGKTGSKSRTYKYGKKLGALPVPKRARYDFLGWYTKRYGGVEYKKGMTVKTKSAELTLYARWAPKQYFQWDKRWGSKRYYTTISGSGCGPTAASMAVYTIAGKGVTPAKAAKWSMKRGYVWKKLSRTNDKFFVKYPAAYDIKSTRLNKKDLRDMKKAAAKKIHKKARDESKKGNWLICLMAPGQWTQTAHFVLWYDTMDGRALVRDPYGSKPAKTRNTVKKLQSQVRQYWLIEVPDKKKIRPE
jgi:uncharacterized repeat protein (TIGR02543 family)